MKRTFLIIALALCSVLSANAQGRIYLNDKRIVHEIVEEDMSVLLGDQSLKMRYDSGSLYLGSRSRYGAMRADYIAFNLYGDEYFSAQNSRKWGFGLVWTGTMLVVPGICLCAGELVGGLVAAGVGAACLGVGIPLLKKGNNRLRGIADDYNSRYAREKSPELTFGPCRSGIGFALNF